MKKLIKYKFILLFLLFIGSNAFAQDFKFTAATSHNTVKTGDRFKIQFTANAKVANVLLDLAKSHGVKNEKGLLVDYLITHQEIGNTIATTRETVSYAFMEFRQMGIIGTLKRRTIILNQKALETVAAD